jgi:pimeloyl-ACP methyl ester carboxylesterase
MHTLQTARGDRAAVGEGNALGRIVSRDGTPITFERSGRGVPLVLVHGTGGALARWAPVRPALEQRFSVVAVDRRGRGQSGDGRDYAVEREFEDIAAVIDAVGEPVHLLGHSFGGLCALEAALLTTNVRKLVLYEPAMLVAGVPPFPAGVNDRLDALLEAGDREGVLTTFMREVVRMPAHEFATFRASPAWPARLAAVHTLPRELRAVERYPFDARRFRDLRIPTLLLTGADSPHFLRAAVDAAAAALPASRVVVMPGQQHIAIDTAPQLFVREVLNFLE